MKSLFSPDSGLSKTLSFIGDLMLLNILYLILCLPILTVGAANAALYSVTLKLVRGHEAGIIKPFFKAFRESFLKASVYWLIFLLTGAAIWFGLKVITENPQTFPWIFNAAYGIVTVLWLLVMTWTWPVEAQFENSILGTLKNAFLIGAAHPLMSIAAIILNLLLPLLFVFMTDLFLLFSFVWFIFGFSGIAALNSLMFNKAFAPLIEQAKAGAEGNSSAHG